MQAVMSSSSKRFTIEQQGDALDFWAWFINTLHQHLSGTKRNKPSIISMCFQVSIIGLRYHLSGAKPNKPSLNFQALSKVQGAIQVVSHAIDVLVPSWDSSGGSTVNHREVVFKCSKVLDSR